MIKETNLREVQEVTGGIISGECAVFNSVSIDSRTIKEKELFIAISGLNFNGNQFVKDAERKNAAAAIVSEELESNLPRIKVKDTRLALGQIGAMNRKASNACVIALTGSQGKTTVKEMTAKILSNCGEVVATEGNLNNDYGVPLSLLKINRQHKFAVIELGASSKGEISYSANLTKPSIAHITNVAATHLEGFGDLDGVAKAKAEIFDEMDINGTAIINYDDAYANDWLAQVKGKKIKTISAKGKKEANYYIGNKSFNNEFSSGFTIHSPLGSVGIKLMLGGDHNISNALAAAALSIEAGASLDHVRSGLEKIKPVKGRLYPFKGINKSTIIDDSYNASPASFRSAIEVLSKIPGTRIIVMGDMGELGSEKELAHVEVGEFARTNKIDIFLTVGKLSKLASKSFGEDSIHFASLESIDSYIKPILKENVTVLIKGSRSAGMEKLVELLIEKKGN